MYIVTGATGWVGKNLLHCLQKIIDRRQFNNEVFCFANKKRKISSTAYREKIEIPIIPLSEINNIFEGNSNLKITVQELLLFHLELHKIMMLI